MPSEFGRLNKYTPLSHVSGSVSSKGAVTQATSVTTTVELNKPSGVITTFAQSGAANTATTFQLDNSLIAADSVVHVSLEYPTAGTGAPSVMVDAIAAGQCNIIILNNHASAALDSVAKVHFVIA